MPALFRALPRALPLALLAAAAACADGDAPTAPASGAPAREAQAPSASVIDDHFPAVPRVGVRVSATGPFRPGVPITLHVSARANRPAAAARLEVTVLDDDGGVDGDGRGRGAGRWAGSLPEGAATRLAPRVTFARPGYYRVAVRAEAAAPGGGEARPRAVRDTVVLDETVELLWIVVDERGGRRTDGFDPAAAAGLGHPLLFGAVGPVAPLPAPAGAAGVRASAAAAPGGPSRVVSAACSGAYVYCGKLRYRALDVAGQPLVPVASASIRGKCWDSMRMYGQNFFATTDADGDFTVDCNQWGWGAGGITIDPPQLTLDHSVTGPGGAAVGGTTDVWWTATEPIDVRLGNDHAGRVYELLRAYVPVAQSRFGLSRSGAIAYVSNAGTDADGCSARYDSGTDIIHQSRTCVFGDYGTFVTLHEYGHAFHYKALEPWRSYTCNSPTHAPDVAYTLSCGFVEGFGDFFAVWVLGSRVSSGAYYSNRNFEQNPFRAIGDGSKIEGAVAAFLLDMVDATGDPDALAGDDDTLAWPASYMGALIRTCSPGGLTRIDGIDEFIYCAEQNVGARTANPYASWRTYGSVAEGATEPSGWTAAKVRSLWRYNLYNLGANP